MDEELRLVPVAHIESDFPAKFGVPRQSGLVDTLARVVLCPAYRSADAVRGLEGFSHLWLIWRFTLTEREGFHATVRPPKLGGNTRLGVFATRAPYRPNPLALSCVKLESVETQGADAPSLLVSGADLVNGTPIYDIKPYLPYADSHPDALAGFVPPPAPLKVTCSEALLLRVPPQKRAALLGVLAQDPRPAYQDDAGRIYGFGFAGLEIKFCVANGVLTVRDIFISERLDKP